MYNPKSICETNNKPKSLRNDVCIVEILVATATQTRVTNCCLHSVTQAHYALAEAQELLKNTKQTKSDYEKEIAKLNTKMEELKLRTDAIKKERVRIGK